LVKREKFTPPCTPTLHCAESGNTKDIHIIAKSKSMLC
jgi:hypothetical protein